MTPYGVFSRYDQTQIAGHPLRSDPRALCIRNESGKDFYELRNEMLAASPPVSQTWLVVNPVSGAIAVAANTVDLVFPQDMRLVAIAQVATPSTLAGQILNADGTISAPPAPTPPTSVPPAERLAAFLRANPDVVELINAPAA